VGNLFVSVADICVLPERSGENEVQSTPEPILRIARQIGATQDQILNSIMSELPVEERPNSGPSSELIESLRKHLCSVIPPLLDADVGLFESSLRRSPEVFLNLKSTCI
jgi:hypothetical protein